MIDYATIVPEKDPDGKPCLSTQGTKVVLPSGESLPGVTGLTIRAATDDVWRATIQCNVRVDARGLLVVPKRINGRVGWWQRFCARLGGFYIDTTTLDSTAREAVSAKNAPRQ